MRTARSIVLMAVVTVVAGAGVQASELEVVDGVLNVVWGDPAPGADRLPAHEVHLTDEHGRSVRLVMSDELARRHGGFHAWNGRQVRAHLRPDDGALAPDARRLAALTLLQGTESTLGGVSGSQPWVSILCKFADVGAEPEDLDYFQGMYSNTFGGLDHYWREVSYDTIDVAGSIAVDWVVLPNNHTFYVPTPGSGTTANLGLIFDHCTAAADPFVDYSNGGSPFVGINQMFNAELDCCAWGGSRFDTLDGVTQSWRVTWEPPWAYAQEGVIAHEMGHGFGLPHSNNFDGDSNPYDSPWDPMSAATSYGVSDPTYGSLGKHVNAYHKDVLGWYAPSERFEMPSDSQMTIVIDAAADASAANYRMAKIPIPGGSSYYTVESRDFLSYDGAIPGHAVIIHEVVPGRTEPSWAVDTDVPPANFGDNPGTMFVVGETYVDAANQISISIDAQVGSGFRVTIASGESSLIFDDGFESGDTTSWDSATP